MLISGYFLAYRVFKEDYLKEFGLLSLKKVMEKNLINGELFHSEGVNAMLDDYVNFIDALITAYEVAEDKSFVIKADELMQICLDRFWDKGHGGFFDTSEEVLGIRLKGIEDIPHPSANSVGIMQLIRLFNHTGRYEYLQYAEKALRAFSMNAKDIGIHAGYYFCALDAYFNMLKLTFHIPQRSRLGDIILSSFSPYTSIVYEDDSGYVLPCIRTECYDPITTEKGFEEFLLERKKTK